MVQIIIVLCISYIIINKILDPFVLKLVYRLSVFLMVSYRYRVR